MRFLNKPAEYRVCHDPKVKMRVLDLCCGLGGFSAAWKEAGHYVLKVDVDPRVRPDVIADVRTLRPEDYTGFDIILAAPPCVEYSRCDKPWLKSSPPDTSIWDACVSFAAALCPRAFVLENVRGAIPFHGAARASAGCRYFWGWFPPLALPKEQKNHKSSRWVLNQDLTFDMNTYERRSLSRAYFDMNTYERRSLSRAYVDIETSRAIMDGILRRPAMQLDFGASA